MGSTVDDSVAIDAKRILLRYGAPIAILDKVTEAHRIEFAREIAKTTLPERERRLRELLVDRGYIVVEDA
jgi:bifunctional DNase/RNase